VHAEIQGTGSRSEVTVNNRPNC